MSRNQRLVLLAAAVAVVVAAIVIAGAPDDESGNHAPVSPEADSAGGGSPTATAPDAPKPARPAAIRVLLRDLSPVGGVKEIAAAKGDTVRFVITSDTPDEIHLHGYDMTRAAAPGEPARFRLKADIEGIFEIESHAAEDAGKDPLIAKLVVTTS